MTEFRIGLLGADSSFVKELSILAERKRVRNIPIKIILYNNVQEAASVELLYVNMEAFPKYRMPANIRNTLVVSDKGFDLYNTMISFLVVEEKLKFALNTYYVHKANLVMNPDFQVLATATVDKPVGSKEKNAEVEKWMSVFDKMNRSLQADDKEITLSKQELEGIVNKLEDQRVGLETKEKNLVLLEKDLSHKEKNLVEQREKISRQESDIIKQKNKIDEQLNSIIGQEQKLALQEKKLQLTIQQNLLQQKELDWKQVELVSQEKKMRAQKQVLNAQKKDIEAQKQVLLIQLDQINTQKIILWLSAAVVLVIFLALGLVYWNYRKTQRINALLERQKQEITEQHTIISNQKSLVEEQHKEITDSINYAQRIQRSLLASDVFLKAHLRNYFIFFQPKNVVSGDFYWASKLRNGQTALVAADSTGHGVPGAIMSMLNISSLNEAVEGQKLTEPAQILNQTRSSIIRHLANDGSAEGGKDGMDCSLLCFDFDTMQLHYAAANNPVWIVRSHALHELEADSMPVGKHDKDGISFSQHVFDLQAGDMVYALTDGYPDQFGGPKGKKFMYRQMKTLLTDISSMPLAEQQQALAENLHAWMGSQEQVDDITVIGVRI